MDRRGANKIVANLIEDGHMVVNPSNVRRWWKSIQKTKVKNGSRGWIRVYKEFIPIWVCLDF